MANLLKIDGIYDARTLKFLKSHGVAHFGLDFNPRSMNFIQEYVLLEQLVPLLSENDFLTLSFTRSDDPMIDKVILDLTKAGIKRENLSLECMEWKGLPEERGLHYYVVFDPQLDSTLVQSPLFRGFVFPYGLFAEMQSTGKLQIFLSQFFKQFSSVTTEKEFVLRAEWSDDLFPSLTDMMDFDRLALPISSEIELCYRNVDLKKLEKELNVHSLKKSFIHKQAF